MALSAAILLMDKRLIKYKNCTVANTMTCFKYLQYVVTVLVLSYNSITNL